MQISEDDLPTLSLAPADSGDFVAIIIARDRAGVAHADLRAIGALFHQ
jgi:hypothetical protein